MKRILSLVLATVMVVSMFAGLQISSLALAKSGKCGKNVYWSFDSSTGTVTIIGEGEMYEYSIADDPSPFVESTVVNVVVVDGVTSIGDCAFYDCSSLKSITIPDSVTSIGDCAFYDCSSLKSITIPDSVTSIGRGTFSWYIFRL